MKIGVMGEKGANYTEGMCDAMVCNQKGHKMGKNVSNQKRAVIAAECKNMPITNLSKNSVSKKI